MRFYCWFIVFIGSNWAFAQIEQKDLEKNYEKALKYFENGKKTEAYRYLDKCLAIDSTWRDAWYAKGFFALESSEYEAATHFFTKSIQFSSLDTLAYLGRAKSFLEIGNYPQTFRDIQFILEKDSTHLQALMDMAYAYATTGYTELAQSYLDKALQKEPENASIWQLKAYTYWLAKDWKQSEFFNDKVLQKNPENIESLKIKAYLLFDKKDFAASLQIFQKIAKIDKYAFEEDDFYQWGMALFHLKAYDKALKIFQSYPNTQHINLLYGQALCYIQQKELTKAWDILEYIEKLEPAQTAEFYYNKAFLAYQLNKKQLSTELYKKSLALMPELYEHKTPKNVEAVLIARTNDLLKNSLTSSETTKLLLEAYQQRALAFLEIEMYEEAKNDLQKTFKLDSLSSINYGIRGLTEALEAKKVSQQYFDKAEKLCRNNAEKEKIYWLRALAASETENYGQSLFFLGKAIELNPQEADYYAEQARIFYQTEQSDAALTSIEKALTLNKENTDYQLDKLKILYTENKMVSLLAASTTFIKNNPLIAEAYFFRALALLADGQKDEAKKDLNYFLLFYPDDKDAKELLKNIP